MLKFGIISEVDASKGLARVYFQEDDFVSAWLKMAVMRSGQDKFSFPFDINEHVYCLMDDNLEYGVVCGAVYDEDNLPDSQAAKGVLSIHFGGGSSILYNRNSSTLSLDIKGKVDISCQEANIQSSGEVKVVATEVSLTAAKTKVNGILEVTGAAIIQGIVSMGGLSGISGAPVTGGDTELSVKKLNATEDVTSGTISLKTHKHLSAAVGSPTGPAIP
jgi:phage baseplate assembly protein V